MAITKRKMKFFDVEMPIINKTTQLQAYEKEELQNKYIKYDLTRILRGKSIEMQLKTKIENGNVIAVPKKTTLLSYFIRRMIRKGTNYVEDSFSAECKNAQLRIKPILVTRRKVSRAVRNALRKKMKEELVEYIKDKEYEKVFEDLLNNKMQKPLSLKLKKIYPLSFCDIRILKVEKEFEAEKNQEIKKEKLSEEKTEENVKIEKTEEKEKPKAKKTKAKKDTPSEPADSAED
ncbi:MAG: hypothetical protein KKA64_00825 [Nanoarchaeota archaeon]|nr:hypothetical protein [Nanoarchaeota archaeon]